MCINQLLGDNFIINKLYLSLTDKKINFLKNLVFGGFTSYLNFVNQYRPDLYLDTRYQDEITEYVDNILINIIKNKVPKYGSRILREHLIIEALINSDMTKIASIIASAARSAVSNIPNPSHFIAHYYNQNYYEIDFEKDERIDEQISFQKSKKIKQYQLVLVF